MDVQNQVEFNEKTEDISSEIDVENTNINEGQVKRIEYKIRAEKQLSGGVSWFYWIAGLSIINTVVYLSGSSWNFIMGLGITQFIDGFVFDTSTTEKVIALLLDVIIAGIFFMFGVMSKKRHRWAIIAGMILYALDALIFIYVKDWVGVAFHVLALSGIYRGLKADKLLRKMGY